MTGSRGPNAYGVPADPFDDESDAAVDAILSDDALLDALGRGELPASYRADVTARLLTGWRDDVDEGLPPLSVPDNRSSLQLATRDSAESDAATAMLARYTGNDDDTATLPRLNGRGAHGLGGHGFPGDAFDDTAELPLFTEPDRIDESVRSAFVAAGYARPSAQLPPAAFAASERPGPASERHGPASERPGAPAGRPDDRPTQHLGSPTAIATFDESDTDGPSVLALNARRPRRRRRFDRVVVAVAATAAIVAAGSAGSVAAAATAHPGDKLWSISRVVYPDRAKSIVASEEAHTSLKKAREALQRGDTETARRYLAEAKDKLDNHVRDGSDEADALAAEIDSTSAMPEMQNPDGTATDSPSSAASGNPSTSASTRSRRQRDQQGRTGAQPASPSVGSTGSTPSPAPDPTQSQGPAGPPPTQEPTSPTDSESPVTESPAPPASEPASPDTGQANPEQEQPGADSPAAATG